MNKEEEFEKLLKVMNHWFEIDRETISKLITRVIDNSADELAGDPYFICGHNWVTSMGMINGILGALGYPLVAYEIDDNGDITEFVRYNQTAK